MSIGKVWSFRLSQSSEKLDFREPEVVVALAVLSCLAESNETAEFRTWVVAVEGFDNELAGELIC